MNLQHLTFHCERSYITETAFGFKIKYTISCLGKAIDPATFKASGMNQIHMQEDLVDQWHREVYVKLFKEFGYQFRFMAIPQWDTITRIVHWNPVLCRIIHEGPEAGVYNAYSDIAHRENFRAISYVKNGCKLEFQIMDFKNEKSLMKENYNMSKLLNLDSKQNTEAYRKTEEGIVVNLLYSHLKLEEEFQHVQINQEHKSSMISAQIKQVGKAIKISWAFSSDNSRIKCFRKTEGFTDKYSDEESNGICVVDSQSAGQSLQQLQAGQEYFYTFILTKEQPIIANNTLGEGVLEFIGSPKITGTATKIVDTLRFAVRVPTQIEIDRIKQLFDEVKKEPVDPNRTKIEEALSGLRSFVEFDEAISRFEEALVTEIESKKYPEEVKGEKIARLKGMVEMIRTKDN